MATTDDELVQEALPDDECRRLLQGASIGRLAFTDAALPVIAPVTYGVSAGHVVVVARRASPIARALRGAVVALGVDCWDGRTRTGWSVNAIGPARVAGTPEEVARFDALFATDLPPSTNRCYVTVRIELLSGWRTPPGREARSGSP